MDKKTKINSLIFALFTSRNQKPLEKLPAIWFNVLNKYDDQQIQDGFNSYITHGDAFPSLPSIIRHIERKSTPESACALAWAGIRKKMSDTKLKLDPNVRKCLEIACHGGITELIGLSDFDMSGVERTFKTLYRDMINGADIEPPKMIEASKQFNALEMIK